MRRNQCAWVDDTTGKKRDERCDCVLHLLGWNRPIYKHICSSRLEQMEREISDEVISPQGLFQLLHHQGSAYYGKDHKC